jgi:hypothetical protein
MFLKKNIKDAATIRAKKIKIIETFRLHQLNDKPTQNKYNKRSKISRIRIRENI